MTNGVRRSVAGFDAFTLVLDHEFRRIQLEGLVRDPCPQRSPNFHRGKLTNAPESDKKYEAREQEQADETISATLELT